VTKFVIAVLWHPLDLGEPRARRPAQRRAADLLQRRLPAAGPL